MILRFKIIIVLMALPFFNVDANVNANVNLPTSGACPEQVEGSTSSSDSITQNKNVKERFKELSTLPLKNRPKFIKHVADSIIDAHTKITTDTNYVVRPKSNWNIRFKVNEYGNFINIYGHDGTDQERKYKLNTSLQTTVGVTVNYRGLSASLAFSPSRLFGHSTDQEYNVNYYGRLCGVDLQYSDIHSLYANNVLTGENHISIDGGRLHSASANGYWVFNSKKFSYPAAFLSTWVQKRSAGTWLAGMSVYVGQLDNNGDFSAQSGYTRFIHRLNMAHISVGGGYAYNLVPNSHWLIHISAQPNVMIWKKYTLYIDDINSLQQYEYQLPTRFPEMFVLGRFAVTYSWGKYFIGAHGMIQTTLIGTNADFHMNNTKWKARIYFGFRI